MEMPSFLPLLIIPARRIVGKQKPREEAFAQRDGLAPPFACPRNAAAQDGKAGIEADEHDENF